MNAVMEGLRRSLERRPGLASRVSDLRLAEGREPGRVVASLEGELTAADTPQLLALQDDAPLSGLGARIGPARNRRYSHLAGDPSVVSEVLGRRYRVHSESFFQGNRFLVEDLARTVRERLPAGGRVLDLYSGVGLFALGLAETAQSVLGIEGNAYAVADAVFNAEAAGLSGVRFLQGDVAGVLATVPRDADERIVLDPPRSGAGVALMQAVAARGPAAIVYVSCDPPTLARDLNAVVASGYRLASLDLFDLFPDTFHLETVALLQRG
jgi:tRNA/tmRNA/rRNA uracil-C5-methylase (TrmA/RlmC/RlmD family)